MHEPPPVVLAPVSSLCPPDVNEEPRLEGGRNNYPGKEWHPDTVHEFTCPLVEEEHAKLDIEEIPELVDRDRNG